MADGINVSPIDLGGASQQQETGSVTPQLNPEVSPDVLAAQKDVTNTGIGAEQGIAQAAGNVKQNVTPVATQNTNAAQLYTSPQYVNANENYTDNLLFQSQARMQDSVNSIHQAMLIAQQDPTADTYKNFFGDHPVLSSIAMVLGGIGSGLTGGSNPAMDILNQRIAGATRVKAAEIDAAYKLATQQSDQAANYLTVAEKNAAINGVSSGIVNSMAISGFQSAMQQSQSQMAPELAKIPIATLAQNVNTNLNPLAALTRQVYDQKNVGKADNLGLITDIGADLVKRAVTPAPVLPSQPNSNVPRYLQPSRSSVIPDTSVPVIPKQQAQPVPYVAPSQPVPVPGKITGGVLSNYHGSLLEALINKIKANE